MFGLSVFNNLRWKSINNKEYVHTEFKKCFDKILSKFQTLFRDAPKKQFHFHRSMGSNGAGGETEGTWTSVMRQVQFPQILLISEN